MPAHFKGPIKNEAKPEIGIPHYNGKWNHVHMVICARHCVLQQRRQQQKTKTTDDDRCCKENLFLGWKLGAAWAHEEDDMKQTKTTG